LRAITSTRRRKKKRGGIFDATDERKEKRRGTSVSHSSFMEKRGAYTYSEEKGEKRKRRGTKKL